MLDKLLDFLLGINRPAEIEFSQYDISPLLYSKNKKRRAWYIFLNSAVIN